MICPSGPSRANRLVVDVIMFKERGWILVSIHYPRFHPTSYSPWTWIPKDGDSDLLLPVGNY
jgi:hypothetical protein